jgi:hypothetical protein
MSPLFESNEEFELARSGAPPLLLPAVRHASGAVFAEPYGVHALIAERAAAALNAAVEDMVPGYMVGEVRRERQDAGGGRRGGEPFCRTLVSA